MLYDPYSLHVQVPAGAVIVRDVPVRAEATIVLDTTGGAALVEFSISDPERIKTGTAIWVPALGLGTAGVVRNTAMMDTIPSAIKAIRVTNQGATPVVMEVCQ